MHELVEESEKTKSLLYIPQVMLQTSSIMRVWPSLPARLRTWQRVLARWAVFRSRIDEDCSEGTFASDLETDAN